jgi:tetratricopeptide (TPR) repeat protein
LYRWGGGQLLTIKTHNGKVEGFLTGNSGCGLERDVPVLNGEWQGDVLVGQVTLCQIGAACRPAKYTFLGFYNAPDGTLTADMELENSCEVPALIEGRLVLEPVAGEEAAAATATSSATQEHRKLGPHTARGQKFLREDNARAAMMEFVRALEKREDAAAAYHGMGLVQANLHHWPQAVRFYTQSLQLRSEPLVYYNLACAYGRLNDKKDALANLRLAIQNGFSSDQDLSKDTDLVPLLGKDPEFRSMIARLQEKSATSASPNSSSETEP